MIAADDELKSSKEPAPCASAASESSQLGEDQVEAGAEEQLPTSSPSATLDENLIKLLADNKLANSLTLDQLAFDFNSLELNWKSSRKSCACSEKAADSIGLKLNCSRCGEIYCDRCVEEGKYLPSQVSAKNIFVCKNCF